MPQKTLDALFYNAALEQYKRYDLAYAKEDAKLRNMLEQAAKEHSHVPDNHWQERHRLYNLRYACAMIINALEPEVAPKKDENNACILE